MSQTFQAIYENGVLRPLIPLDLEEREVVSLEIERANGRSSDLVDSDEEWLDKDAADHSRRLADPNVPLADVRKALSGIHGDLADAVSQQRGDY